MTGMTCPGLLAPLSNAADTPASLLTDKPTPCCADTLPTALSNAADESTPPSAGKPTPLTDCADVCASCDSIKGELSIATKKIAELEAEISRLKNCSAASTVVDISGLSGVMEGQEKVLSGLQWERLEPEER